MIKNLRMQNQCNMPFVIIPDPLQDELLSSWLARTSYTHHLHPKTFINLYFGFKKRTLFKKNIDTSLNADILNEIEIKCKNKIDIYALTLKTYSGYIQENDIEMASSRFFGSLKFCPTCLRDDEIPYFRKSWAMMFSTVCILHNCFLYDSCPQCNSKLSILKMYKDKLTFKYCSQCGFELKRARIIKVNEKYSNGKNAQTNLQYIADIGYVNLNNTFVYSFYFFDTIIQITKLIITKKNTKYIDEHPLFNLLQKSFNREINLAISIYTQLDTKERFALFGLVWYLFENYPKNFASFINKNKLTHWNMVKDIRHVSFWYDNLVNDIVPRYVSFGNMVTKEEIENGKRYLMSQGLDITQANLSRLFGNINYFYKYKI